MDFFSNIIKNTANKVEALGKSATAAVNSTLSPTSEDKTAQDDSGEAVTATNEEYQQYQQEENDATTEQTEQQTEGDQEDTAGANSPTAAFNSAEMSHKALESAKYFGSFILSAANKAGQTVTVAAKQVKSTIESVGIMQDFTKEQQEFIKDHGGKTELAEPPWVGCEDEEKVKTEILSLSQDKRNFVRSPPAGVQFPFDMNASYPVALALLREDPELAKMRYELVPKLVNEETFWRNYFYRVSLIKQDPAMAGGDGKAARSWGSSKSSSSEGPDDPDPAVGETEFVSDSFQNSNVSAEEVRQDMYKLGVHSNQDIDDELAKDLQDFDFVPADGGITDTGKTIDEDEINRELANFDIK